MQKLQLLRWDKFRERRSNIISRYLHLMKRNMLYRKVLAQVTVLEVFKRQRQNYNMLRQILMF